jgi:uncharacterized protein
MSEQMLRDSVEELDGRYQRLQQILKRYGKVIVAYSGGVDSAFLLKAAVESLGADKVLAAIGVSESLAQSEYGKACELAEQMGAAVEVVHPEEMNDPGYQKNPPNRCFYCKSQLYRLLNDLAKQRGYEAVLCGTNVDDLGDFRPGLRAAKEYQVASPLEEAGLTKADIRVLSKRLGLETWDKPAQPCLASRVPYGMEITVERLKQIEEGEEFLRGLGLRELRVRHHGELVRIEVPTERIIELVTQPRREEIVAFFKKLGFSYVSLDLQGFRSGSGNEVL